MGEHLKRVLIMSNRPNDMPPAVVNNINDKLWRISKFKLLKDGGKRSAKDSWKETVEKVNEELQRDPSIQWIVRSDSDTWWNVPLLEEQLLTNMASSTLHPEEPLAMGQFFPLVNFKWKREVSAERSLAPDLTHSNGADAYLSGGAGVILTRKGMENLYACFPNVTLKSHSKEDI